RFLQAGAVGVLGFPALLRADEKKDDPFGGFTMGVQSYCFRNFDTEPALKRTQELGIKHIEFYSKHAPPGSTPEQIQALLKLCGEYGIKPIAFGVHTFTKDHDASKKVFEFGKALGIQKFTSWGRVILAFISRITTTSSKPTWSMARACSTCPACSRPCATSTSRATSASSTKRILKTHRRI